MSKEAFFSFVFFCFFEGRDFGGFLGWGERLVFWGGWDLGV